MRANTDVVLTDAEVLEIKRLRREARERVRASPRDEIEPAEVDPENPPLTDEQLAAMRPAHEVHPALVAASLRRIKQPVSIRLDRDLLDALRATGEGWQTRVNEMLRRGMGLTN